MSSAPPLVIELNRSIWLATFIAIGHAGGLVCLWLTPLPLWAKALITAPVMFGAARYLQHYAWLKTSHAVVRLEWHAGGWLLTDNDGRQYPAQLTAGSMRSRLLTVLLFSTEGRSLISVPICRDMLVADDYRRLQLCLTVRSDAGLAEH